MSHSTDFGFQAAHKFFGSQRSSIAETSSHNEFIAGCRIAIGGSADLVCACLGDDGIRVRCCLLAALQLQQLRLHSSRRELDKAALRSALYCKVQNGGMFQAWKLC